MDEDVDGRLGDGSSLSGDENTMKLFITKIIIYNRGRLLLFRLIKLFSSEADSERILKVKQEFTKKLQEKGGRNIVLGLKDKFDDLWDRKDTEIKSLKLGPSLSAVLAVTSLTSKSIKISDFPRNSLPDSVVDDLKKYLVPFLKAAATDGYQTILQRKCFIIGNSGTKLPTNYTRSIKYGLL